MGTEADAQDMEFYGGLSYGFHSSDTVFGIEEYSFEGSSVGIFGGVNVPLANGWVVGGELSYTGEIAFAEDFYSEGNLTDVIDLKARAGKTFGNGLAFGSVGFTRASVDWGGGLDVEGKNASIGYEHTIGDSYFVGGEYTRRWLDDETGFYLDNTAVSTASIRFGMRF